MKITEYDFSTEKISREYTFAILSDMHSRDFDEAVKLTGSFRSDAVLVVGDIVDRHYRRYDKALPFLGACTDLAPVFFSFGNHEMKFPMITKEEIELLGVTVLDNSFVPFGDLLIGGQIPDAGTEWLKDFEDSEPERFHLLMDHHPEHFPRYLRDEHKKIDLIVSGHAHGGQIRIRNQGILSPGQGFFPKYTKGLYDGRLLVGTGLANTGKPFPRLCNEPEVLKLTLKKQA